MIVPIWYSGIVGIGNWELGKEKEKKGFPWQPKINLTLSACLLGKVGQQARQLSSSIYFR